jgi:hypothetical protein
MSIANDPQEMLLQSAQLIEERGAGYGGIENNFQLISELFTLRIGREFHPYEVCVLMECVKDARMFSDPANVDNYLDGINYKAFAALFAQDYAASRMTVSPEISYKRKDAIKKAEIRPVEISAKKKVQNIVTAPLNIDAISALDAQTAS